MSNFASVYPKVSALGLDNELLVEPRSGIYRKTNLGTNWIDARFGFWMSLCDWNDSNRFPTIDEIIYNDQHTNPQVPDRFLFGLKNSSNGSRPGKSDAYFLGFGTADASDYAQNNRSNVGRLNVRDVNFNNAYYKTETQLNAQVLGNATYSKCGISPQLNAAYAGLWFGRLTVANLGLANQTISWWGVINGPDEVTAGADYSPSALYNRLTIASWAQAQSTLLWASNGQAWPLPDAFYIQNPFYFTKLRISCIAGISIGGPQVATMSAGPNGDAAVTVGGLDSVVPVMPFSQYQMAARNMAAQQQVVHPFFPQ